MCEHAVQSCDTDKMPNPGPVVLVTSKVPATTAPPLSSERVRQPIDICGSTVYVQPRGEMNAMFRHKICCRKWNLPHHWMLWTASNELSSASWVRSRRWFVYFLYYWSSFLLEKQYATSRARRKRQFQPSKQKQQRKVLLRTCSAK